MLLITFIIKQLVWMLGTPFDLTYLLNFVQLQHSADIWKQLSRRSQGALLVLRCFNGITQNGGKVGFWDKHLTFLNKELALREHWTGRRLDHISDDEYFIRSFTIVWIVYLKKLSKYHKEKIPKKEFFSWETDKMITSWM